MVNNLVLPVSHGLDSVFSIWAWLLRYEVLKTSLRGSVDKKRFWLMSKNNLDFTKGLW